jgi:hypothetical protein
MEEPQKIMDECSECNNSNTFVFTVGRMNPPTPGHLELIREMLTFASQHNINKVYIFVSERHDDNENPLLCSNKLAVLMGSQNCENVDIKEDRVSINKPLTAKKEELITQNAMFDTDFLPNASYPMIQWLKDDMAKKNMIVNGITICVVCFPGSQQFGYINYLANKIVNVEPIYLVGFFGSERDSLGASIKKYFESPTFNSKYKYITHVGTPRSNMDEYKGVAKDPAKLKAQVMSELPDGSVSASFVRNIVAQGDDFYYKFEELYTPYLKDPVIIRAFYDAIKKGLGRSSKSQVKSTTLRKRKPEPSVELPNKNTNVLNGGRKTRKTRKTRKSRKKRKTRKTRKKSRRKRVTTK